MNARGVSKTPTSDPGRQASSLTSWQSSLANVLSVRGEARVVTSDQLRSGHPGTRSPRVLVAGHGHAGGSVAEVAAAAGCTVEIWGRRPEKELTAALRRLVLDRHSNASYRQRDLFEVPDLERILSTVDWIVLANEPRPQHADREQLRAAVEMFSEFYRTCRRAGFHDSHRGPSGVRRAIVRIGSPPAEQPAAAGLDLDSPYFAVKQNLEGLAAAESAMGLALLTVAPSEIHSPFSTYGPDDPYHRGLTSLDRMPVIHDVASAAVSDRSVGQSVLAAAAGGEVGAWYQVSDATLGPGAALRRMAEHLGMPVKPLATWRPAAARHLLDVLENRAGLDLELVATHTSGLEMMLSPALSLSEAQRTATAAALWWAPPRLRERALASLDHTNRLLAGELVRATTDQLAPRMLAILLAMGPDRSDAALDQLLHGPGGEPASSTGRLIRLQSAVDRQADELRSAQDVRSSM